MYIREKSLDFIREYPGLYFRIVALKRKYNDILVNPSTDIVIEGYPRSANTFAVAAFELAQERPIIIARHTHAVAQIKRAVALKKPILVVLREPEEAALSYVIRENNVTIKLALERYVRFYCAVKKLRKDIVISDFKQVTNNFGAVTERINAKFGTEFQAFINNEENVNRVFRKTEQMEVEHAGGELSESKVGRPSAARDAIKRELFLQLKKTKYQRLLSQCQVLYNELEINF